MSTAKRLAMLSALTAAAIIFSYAESLLPIPMPLPGFRIGFANTVLLLALRKFGLPSALAVGVARTIVVSLLFASITSAVFSLVGGVLALIVMWALGKCSKFSIFGQSVGGAVAHNIGQAAVAAVMVGVKASLSYLPYLMICSLASGLLIGFIAALIERKTAKIGQRL